MKELFRKVDNALKELRDENNKTSHNKFEEIQKVVRELRKEGFPCKK